MKPLDQYVNVKDKYAIYYLGNAYEYVVQLICLMPYIKKALPSLKVDIYCNDDICESLGAKPLSSLHHWEYGFIRELTYDLDCNCIEKLLKESKIPYGPVDIPLIEGSNLCIVCPDALLPNKSLTFTQVQKAKELAIKAGYAITDDFNKAGWVIGPENYPLFLAASRGLKTSLIPTGFGTDFYKTLFPSGEILNV